MKMALSDSLDAELLYVYSRHKAGSSAGQRQGHQGGGSEEDPGTPRRLRPCTLLHLEELQELGHDGWLPLGGHQEGGLGSVMATTQCLSY